MEVVLQKSVTKTETITPTQSVTLVKNIFRAAFSSVAYIRNFFDDDCFQLGRIGTTRYHKIVSVERNDVKLFVDWLEQGVFHALQQNYLDIVVLQVYEQLPSKKSNKKPVPVRTLLESYTFNISYEDGRAHLQLSGTRTNIEAKHSKDEIKRSTSEFLRSLVQMTSTLGALPQNRLLSMKLLYTDSTPKDYEPPLFRKVSDDETSWFEENPPQSEVDPVTTPYHQLSMSIRRTNKGAQEILYAKSKHVNKEADNATKIGNGTKIGNNTVKKGDTIQKKKPSVSSKHDGREYSGSQDFKDEKNGEPCFNLQRSRSHPRGQKTVNDRIEEPIRVSGRARGSKKRKMSTVEKEIEQTQRRAKKAARTRK